MSEKGTKVEDIKAHLDRLGLAESLPRARQPQRRLFFGMAMLVLSVFIVAAGLYLPAQDSVGRAVFMFGALLYAAIGAYSVDRANRAPHAHDSRSSG